MVINSAECAAASTGSIRGAVRALFRTQETATGHSDVATAVDGAGDAPELLAAGQAGSRNNFSDVSLCDSPR